jgi:hypothetical protein
MRIKSNTSSAGEQARSAEARRSAKPGYGKSKWFASAVGGAVALGTMALCGGSAYAAPITPPGEEAGLNAASPLPEGIYFINIFGTGGDYLIDDKKSNLTFNVPIVLWATPWQANFLGFTGRFELAVAAPEIGNVGIPYCNNCGVNPLTGSSSQGVPPPLGGRDYTAMYNPFFEAGFAWDLGGGWGFSSFNGGYGPVDNELRYFGQNIWVYNNRTWLGWSGNLWNSGLKDGGTGPKFTIAIENVYGLTGDDVQTGLRVKPNYDNVNLGAWVTLGKWNLGLVAFYTTDIENYAYGPGQCGGKNITVGSGNSARTIVRSCEQSRAAIGPLVQYDFSGISVQANYTFDVMDDNYRNIDGSRMQIDQFWLKTVIPLWSAPKLETSLK